MKDTVLRSGLRARAAADRSQVFIDGHGHRIVVSTDIVGLDLRPYANVLAGTLHYREIEDLSTRVLEPAGVQAICGTDAEACYGGQGGATSSRGEMVIPRYSDDLAHIIVHEYGHHVDNQLANLAHIFPRGACGFDNDGSRNWFFEREVEDNILGRGTSCRPDAGWDKLLGELYAEDYTWLVGNRRWVLQADSSPTPLQLKALGYDFAHPLDALRYRMRRLAPRRRIRIFRRFTIDDWRFVTATLRGPRRADLDLFLYRRAKRRPLAKSTGRGSRERIEEVIPPGRYEVGVGGFRSKGHGRLRIALD